jgi:hypothetical protein
MALRSASVKNVPTQAIGFGEAGVEHAEVADDLFLLLGVED